MGLNEVHVFQSADLSHPYLSISRFCPPSFLPPNAHLLKKLGCWSWAGFHSLDFADHSLVVSFNMFLCCSYTLVELMAERDSGLVWGKIFSQQQHVPPAGAGIICLAPVF